MVQAHRWSGSVMRSSYRHRPDPPPWHKLKDASVWLWSSLWLISECSTDEKRSRCRSLNPSVVFTVRFYA